MNRMTTPEGQTFLPEHQLPVVVGQLDAPVEGITGMHTLVEALVSIDQDGNVTVSLSGRSIYSALAEMERG